MAAILHAVIFSILIFKKEENKKANRFYVLCLIALAHTLFTKLILEQQWYPYHQWLFVLPFGLSFLIAPSFYFYIKFLVYPGSKFKKLELIHFVPVIFNYLHSFYHLINGPGIYHSEFHNFTEAVQLYATFPALVYLYFAYRMIRQYEESLLDQFSNVDNRKVNWAKQLIIVYVSATAITLIFVIADFHLLFDFKAEFSESNLFRFDQILTITYAISLYWSSLGTYNQQQVENEPIKAGKTHDKKDYSDMASKLTEAMEKQHMYRHPELKLRTLEDELKITPKEISATLNHHFKKNFYEFVNSYRVNDAMRRLESAEFDHLTIEAIAYQSGFNSKASFHRIFKEHIGIAPGSFRTRK
ncbi:MAG: helix-turn-helix domain-containing protein [Cyclobacteriaceae bacterium]